MVCAKRGTPISPWSVQRPHWCPTRTSCTHALMKAQKSRGYSAPATASAPAALSTMLTASALVALSMMTKASAQMHLAPGQVIRREFFHCLIKSVNPHAVCRQITYSRQPFHCNFLEKSQRRVVCKQSHAHRVHVDWGGSILYRVKVQTRPKGCPYHTDISSHAPLWSSSKTGSQHTPRGCISLSFCWKIRCKGQP